MSFQLQSGRHNHLGARFDGEGTNFAVFSANASRIDLCLFSEDGKTEVQRLPLPEKTGHIWHGYAPGLQTGTLYGYRADGAYAPERGHRFNANKLLMDPYTRELRGKWTNHTATLGYNKRAPVEDLSFDSRDSAPHVARSVVSSPDLFNHIEPRDVAEWSDRLIYEAHPKGLTMLHPDVPKNLRGTYEGIASQPVIDHLQKLGVTAIELLPVHSFLDDGFLVERRLRNYWGYNTIGFFAPEPRYFGPHGFAGFRAMVQRFHQAGIKVILDVVYNHTAEGDQRGPTLCYRGLDNASYYRLQADDQRFYVNDTGCGNTVNVSNPFVLRMVMDSLRFWVQQMGIDGFRFDLASTLGREDHGFDRQGGFFDTLRQDPVLADAHLIAEPWDIGPGGYQLGGFPSEFSEWNDRYRDSVRKFWRGDEFSAQEMGEKLLGSSGQFDHDGRRAWSSVNHITAHDGFTLADVTAYNERHNEANGEGGVDGHSNNLSDNCGVEGETDDPEIQARRIRRQRNMLATLFLSQGTPMLLSGDEIGNSQQGNNNAYAQDNPLGWLNWDQAKGEMVDFVARLSQFRRDHACLRQSNFLHGEIRNADELPDVEWTDFSGAPQQWTDPALPHLCLTVRGSAEVPPAVQIGDTVLIAFNRSDQDAIVKLPAIPPDQHWVRAIDTAADDVFAVCECDNTSLQIAANSVVAAVAKSNGVAYES